MVARGPHDIDDLASNLSAPFADEVWRLMCYRDTYEGSTYFRRKVRHYCQSAALLFGLDLDSYELVELAVMYSKLGTTRLDMTLQHDCLVADGD